MSDALERAKIGALLAGERAPVTEAMARTQFATMWALISVAEGLDILAQIEKKKWAPGDRPGAVGQPVVPPGDDPGGPCE